MAYLKQLSKDEGGNDKTKQEAAPDSNERFAEETIDAGTLKQSFFSRNKRLLLLFIILVLFLLGGYGIYYSFFGGSRSGPVIPGTKEELQTTPGEAPDEIISKELDPAINAGEKTEDSPINGELYTVARSEFWKNRRPLAVIIENHVASRPPYSLSDAEIVYEAVAEGGITRFVAFFLAKQAPRLEPIRSVRSYFLDWVGDHDAILVHHGGANSEDERTDALGNIERWNVANLDCMAGGGLCSRDPERFAPHNSMSNTAHLWNVATQRGINKPPEYNPWLFKNDASEAERPMSQVISYNFWDDPDYLVRWEYDKATNTYKRFNGNLLTDKHIDANYGEQIASKTVIVQEMGQQIVNDGTPYPHLVFDTVGTGSATIFMDGVQLPATWEKKSRTEKVKFFDAETGEEVSFNRGQIWISVVPLETFVTVQ